MNIVVEQSSSMQAWKLLDRIRAVSPMDSHEFTQGLAALLFLRWADFQEAELEAMAAFDDTSYEPVLSSSLHWRTLYQQHPQNLRHFLADHLFSALSRLSNSRHNPLATQLHRIASPLQKLIELPESSLAALIKWLADQPFETPHDRRQLLEIFDSILQSNQDKNRGEFRTPSHVAKLMVTLAAPTAGENIYDPCFGAAGLLTNAIDYAAQNSEQSKVRNSENGLRVSGIELNESAYIIGLTRLVLAGCDDPQLEYGNSLLRPPLTSPNREGFDVVIANPPWGWTARMDERYGLEHYPVMTKDSTGLFIQHALSNLRPNGRAVIAVPNSILFRGGTEQKMREWLIANHTVEAVISLPETAFLPNTAIKASLLVLRRGGSTTKIRMVEAESFFQKGKGRQPATISENQLLELVGKIQTVTPADFCWDIDSDTLANTNYDLTPRRRTQSGLIDIFSSLGPSIEIVQLKDCCREIFLGRQIRATDLLDELPPTFRPDGQQKLFPELEAKAKQQSLFEPIEPLPFIRIKDINKGQANKGSSWVSPDAALGVERQWKLRAGDVLLSKSGTIGKVGVVRNGAVGAVAAGGLYVLRTDRDRLDPHYLAAYLDSAESRAWLQDHASGGVISHLTKRMIEELPVPIPPLQIQHQVATMWREHGEDALAFLVQLISKDESDPIAEWLGKALQNWGDSENKSFTPLDFARLENLTANIFALRNTLRNSMVHTNTEGSVLGPWFNSFVDAVEPLVGLSKLPHGPALFGVLLNSSIELEKSIKNIAANSPYAPKALKLISLITKLLDAGSTALINDTQLVFSTDDSELRIGVFTEVLLKVTNDSRLPLRNIEIRCDPDWDYGSIEFLKENDFEFISIFSPVQQVTGPIILRVHWTAQTVIGSRVEGEREIVFNVVDDAEKNIGATTELGASPYVCGDPIRPERNDVFFGREELLNQIRRQIIQSGNVVLLEGNRRAGKSSILRHLEGFGPVPGWLGVYCSLQGAEGSQAEVGVPTAAVFREIAISIAKAMVTLGIEVPLPNGTILPPGQKIGIAKACRQGISEEHSFADFRDYVEIALDAAAEKHLGILLMMDEFDKLQEGIDNGVTSPQVPENIRFLVQAYPGFSAILTGSRRLKRLREEYWSALFGLGTRFGVTSLSPEAARRLVTEPVKDRLLFSREAIEKAIILTNRQPFLLQSLCNRVFDMAAQLKIRSISLDEIEEAATLLADDNEHFRSLWNYAETDRRRFILGLIQKESAGPDPLRFGYLRELLSTHGVEVDDEALSSDIEFLRELELIDLIGESGSGHYTLAIPLMGKWIDRQHDFEVLRNKARMETEETHG